jgi:Na+-driven multidrug efflux pump
MLLTGGALARALAESEVTATLTRIALWVAPFAALAGIPFQLCRPVFEGLQRGRPGLVMAVVRYVILTVPLGLAGMGAARAFGQPPLFGLLFGLVAASALSSGVFLVWMGRALGRLRVPDAAPEVRASSAPDPSPAP